MFQILEAKRELCFLYKKIIACRSKVSAVIRRDEINNLNETGNEFLHLKEV